jgi:uncharacterized membrane protein YoaK (UPF0700 family)
MTEARPPRLTAITRATPTVLSVVAGYVDSCTYLGLFRVCVAQLTGSLVLAGTGFVKSEPGAPERLLGIPSFFFASVAVSLLIHSMRERPRAALACSLTIECFLLIGLFISYLAGMPFRDLEAPTAIAAILFGMAAMGVQSTLVHLLMQGVASTNVMTMNTTRLAIDTGKILVGWIGRNKPDLSQTSKEDYTQARREFAALLPLWLGFLAGAALGAVAFVTVGLCCVLFAILPVGILALWYGERGSRDLGFLSPTA